MCTHHQHMTQLTKNFPAHLISTDRNPTQNDDNDDNNDNDAYNDEQKRK